MAQFPPNVQGAGDPLGYNHYLSWGPDEWNYSFGNQLGGSGYDSRNLGLPYYSDAFGLYPEQAQPIMPTSGFGISGFSNNEPTFRPGGQLVLTSGAQNLPNVGATGEASTGYSGIPGVSMQLGEAAFGPSVIKTIAEYSHVINQTAAQYGVSESLIKAIIYEEQTHSIPFVESRRAESLGLGKTVGLGQITVGLYGYTREQLLNPVTNINVIGLHLRNLQTQLISRGIEPTPAALATLYNWGSGRTITDYGRRVQEFYIRFEFLR